MKAHYCTVSSPPKWGHNGNTRRRKKKKGTNIHQRSPSSLQVWQRWSIRSNHGVQPSVKAAALTGRKWTGCCVSLVLILFVTWPLQFPQSEKMKEFLCVRSQPMFTHTLTLTNTLNKIHLNGNYITGTGHILKHLFSSLKYVTHTIFTFFYHNYLERPLEVISSPLGILTPSAENQ